jgi:hypothetical protein
MIQETNLILEEALGLVQRGWTSSRMAVDRRGRDVDPGSERAVKWCASGAVWGAMERLGMDTEGLDDVRYQRAVRRVARAAGCEDDDWRLGIEAAVMSWNLDQSQEDVVLVFKHALAGHG